MIIDGNSLVFRAYYAMQNPMVTSKGVYTQAVFGFLNMLHKALADNPADYIAACFDRKAPTFRHLEYAAYKAGRQKTPDELAMQVPYIKDILCAMHVAVLEMDGFEADDLIGTVAKRAEAEGLTALIITGDRDQLQLASERTSVLITKKGVSEFELSTPASMLEKYGFPAAQFVDYKALMGDASDNIPGLPGVGEKTAAKLICQFGTVENLLAHADEVTPPRIRGIVEENAQLATMSKRLATIVTDVPVEVDFAAMRVRAWDVPKLRQIYTELEFRMFLKRLDEQAAQYAGEVPGADGLPKVDGQPKAAAPTCPLETITVDSMDALETLKNALSDAETAVLKLFGGEDHVHPPEVYAIFLLVNNNFYCVDTRNSGELLRKAADLLLDADVRYAGYGLQSDLYKLKTLRGGGSLIGRVADDVQIAHYLLAPSNGGATLAQVLLGDLGVEVPEPPKLEGGLLLMPFDEIRAYGAAFCAAVQALAPVLREKLAAEGQLKLYEEVELPLAATLAETEVNGFAFDAGALTEIDRGIIARVEELTEGITELAGEAFNINSPKQLGEILFEKIGLPGGKKNKNGYSTSADVLEKLRGAHPIIPLVLEYRTLTKLKSTYIDGLPAFVGADGRIRAHLRQTVAATGRLSCTDPNLQNIPVRQELGRTLRKAFVPGGPGLVLMGADYSQIELRVLAHFSEDPALLGDFRSGADIHSRTAARVFGVEPDAVTLEQRSAAKAVNFGIIYGMSGFGLSENLSITRKDAERFIGDYFAQHARVKAWLDAQIAAAKALGYTTTILGRRRAIPEIHASQYMVRQMGERLAMNSPVQGSAADIIKVAMNRVHARLEKEGLAARLILQVHDELILEVPVGEVDAAARVLQEEMEGAVELRVPLVAEIKTGGSWFELK
jgi:DNA polymerase-1